MVADIKDLDALVAAAAGVDAAFHFAANPDIAAAVAQPDIDFWEGTYLTQNVLEAMRRNGVPRLIYASGSGVYGDLGEQPSTRTSARCCRSRPTARASSRAKR